MKMKTYYTEEVGGVTYERETWMYSVGWLSYERGVQPGEVRVINEVIHMARYVTSRGPFRKKRVTWNAVDPSFLKKVQINRMPEE